MDENLLGLFKGTLDSIQSTFYTTYRDNIYSFDDLIEKYPDILCDLFNNVTSSLENTFHLGVRVGMIPWKEILVIDQYKQFLDVYEELDKLKDVRNYQRDIQRGSRSHWQGGGFGIQGALKGALIAGAMNAGTNILRSVGDSMVDANDSRFVENQKRELFDSIDARELLSKDITESYVNLFAYFFG